MCGICGIVDFYRQGKRQKRIDTCNVIKSSHRGPDDGGGL